METPDLTLPDSAPEIKTYPDHSRFDAKFYLYSLIPGVRLKNVAAGLQKDWYEEGNEDEIVQIAKPTGDFAGKTPVAQHRMVYATLGDKMGREIHALKLTTRAG